MPNYDSWEQLIAAAQKECRTILKEDVAPVAKNIVIKHAKEDIYEAVSPYTGRRLPTPGAWVIGSYGTAPNQPSALIDTYQRRYTLMNPRNIYSAFTSDPDEIMITSNAAPSAPVVRGTTFSNAVPGAFFKLLESRNLGVWKSGFPRPAITLAQKEINKSADIRAAIQRGIEMRLEQ